MNRVLIIPEFISQEEETIISENIKPSNREAGGRSSIQRYGITVYNNYQESNIIPEWLLFPGNKLVEQELLESTPKHVTVNYYRPGDKILPHIDKKESGPKITILSLLSDVEMILTKGNQREKLFLPRRSILQLTDEARWDWKHSIEEIKENRISIVYRIG